MSPEDVLARLQDVEARMDALSRVHAYLRERVDELENELEALRSRVNTQGQMVVGEGKLRKELDALKCGIGQLSFIDLDIKSGDGGGGSCDAAGSRRRDNRGRRRVVSGGHGNALGDDVDGR